MASKNCETIFNTLPTHLLIKLSKTQIKPSLPRLKTKQVLLLSGVILFKDKTDYYPNTYNFFISKDDLM